MDSECNSLRHWDTVIVYKGVSKNRPHLVRGMTANRMDHHPRATSYRVMNRQLFEFLGQMDTEPYVSTHPSRSALQVEVERAIRSAVGDSRQPEAPPSRLLPLRFLGSSTGAGVIGSTGPTNAAERIQPEPWLIPSLLERAEHAASRDWTPPWLQPRPLPGRVYVGGPQAPPRRVTRPEAPREGIRQSRQTVECKWPDAFTETAASVEDRQCTLCFVNTRSAAIVDCGHSKFCVSCLRQLAEPRTCPNCRRPITHVIRLFE